MLTHIHVRDFAIVEELDLTLSDGMTAITGETGAGKSIMIDALGLALGERAESAMVRHGARRAQVTASFDLSAIPAAREWLTAQDLDAEDGLILRRVVSAEGRSRAYVNGSPMPAQALKELGNLLVDIHGQHEHQSLLRPEDQSQLLDGYAGNGELLAAVAETCRRWRDGRRRLKALEDAAAERSDRLDLLRFQVDELEALGLGPEEPAALDEEHRRLANAGQILETGQGVLGLIYEDEQALSGLLAQAGGRIQDLAASDPALAPVAEMLSAAQIQVDEAADHLRRYLGNLDLDPQRLAWLDERIGQLHHLARKHRVEPEELPAHGAARAAELAHLENADTEIEGLAAEVAAAEAAWREAAGALTAARQGAAEQLSTKVTEAMQGLAMEGGRFQVEVQPDPQARPDPQGADRIAFTVSANPGQPLMPLAKVASGGELSRISLAIQVITADAARIPTLIFDEVDTGIGGATAAVVGRLVRSLGDARQVVSVTHLPQVAAHAHHQLRVRKVTDGATTHTDMEPLDGDARVAEIARMLGGETLTDTTLEHAREMIGAAARA